MLRQLRHDLLYYPFRAALEIGSRLPLAALRPLGRACGRLATLTASRSMRWSDAHIAQAFPEMDAAQRSQLLRAAGRHFGEMLAEVVWLWRASPSEVLQVCTVTGREHFDRALETGRGVVLTTGHCGNWEVLNAWIGSAGYPMTIAVREAYDPRIDRVASHLRSRFGPEVISRGAGAGRRLAEALHRSRIVGLLIDQDIRDIPSVFVPFFGRDAWTPSGAASLALATGCPIVPGFVHRTADRRHRIELLPPLTTPRTGDPERDVPALTAAATAAIEAQIRAHPEQWVWMHRRWRTRPPEETS
jgi:KDO2-lipid IV(A) lauroyltransferase